MDEDGLLRIFFRGGVVELLITPWTVFLVPHSSPSLAHETSSETKKGLKPVLAVSELTHSARLWNYQLSGLVHLI